MVNELRWILAAICVPLLVGIWWWTARRSRQAAGDSQLRDAGDAGSAPASEAGDDAGETRDSPPHDWGVPPFEPLSIRTADFEAVEVPDQPMSAYAEPFDGGDIDSGAITHPNIPPLRTIPVRSMVEPAPPPPPPPTAAPGNVAPVNIAPPNVAPAPASFAPQETGSTGTRTATANTAETQRIVMLRVCAPGEVRWSGGVLLAALDDQGLAHGRYQVFHRKHGDGRTVFCAASLVEPGSFNLERMPAEEYRGLTLFAVLPGPLDALQAVDALLDAAGGLAQSLHGIVQDSKGAPLTVEAVQALREDAAQFQALTMD